MVPGLVFALPLEGPFGGVVHKWGSFRNASLQKSWGYDIHYDAGDEYWMLESDVALYLLPPTNMHTRRHWCCGTRGV